MSARETILKTIRKNRPAEMMLNKDFATKPWTTEKTLERFRQELERQGTKLELITQEETIYDMLDAFRAKGKRVINCMEEKSGPKAEELSDMDAASLDNVYLACMQAQYAVAENGAVWVNAQAMRNRLLPFICQHLVLLLPVSGLVSDMHEAYARIEEDELEYGVFIAGPSRTADIEQSLVIGAHGPLRLSVFLINNN